MTITSKKLPCYTTEDGQSFLDINEAKKHDLRIQLLKWSYDIGLCRGGEWSYDMVIKAMIENKDLLKEIFCQDIK